jgi:hypothetical protein
MAQSEGSTFKQKPFTMSKYEKAAEHLEYYANGYYQGNNIMQENFRDAAALLRQQGEESVPSADKIKSIAEQYFIESKPDWKDENQKADTTFGFRMGYKHALLHSQLKFKPEETAPSSKEEGNK